MWFNAYLQFCALKLSLCVPMSNSAHAMGNSSGSLSDYWEVIKQKEGLQGGFIWDWIDQGLLQRDKNGKVWHAYGGDYGDEPHDANFNINGMISPDRVPHPAMIELKKCAQPVDFELVDCSSEDGESFGFKVRVHNRRYFTTINDLVGTYTLKEGGFDVTWGSFSLPYDLSPQMSVVVPIFCIGAPENDRKGWDAAEFHLDVGAAVRGEDRVHGKGVSSEQFYINDHIPWMSKSGEKPLHLAEMLKDADSSPVAQSETKDDHICLSTNHTHVKFKQGSAGFEYFPVECDNMKRIALLQDMEPILFRGATDNDGVKQLGKQFDDGSKPLGKWLRLGLDCITLEDAGLGVGCRVLGDGRPHPSVFGHAKLYGWPGKSKYDGIAMAEKLLESKGDKPQRVELGRWEQIVTMHSNGSLFVETTISLEESLKDVPRVGLQFSVPSCLYEACYFADGPHENYVDRRLSARAGVDADIVPRIPSTYVVPQEQGNRMNMRWL